jgi:hypothetical protein
VKPSKTPAPGRPAWRVLMDPPPPPPLPPLPDPPPPWEPRYAADIKAWTVEHLKRRVAEQLNEYWAIFAASEQCEWDHENECFMFVRPSLEDDKYVADVEGDLEPLRQRYPEIAEYIHSRKRGHGKRRHYPNWRVKSAIKEAKFIRHLWFQTYGFQRQRRDDGMPRAEQIAAEILKVDVRSIKSR